MSQTAFSLPLPLTQRRTATTLSCAITSPSRCRRTLPTASADEALTLTTTSASTPTALPNSTPKTSTTEPPSQSQKSAFARGRTPMRSKISLSALSRAGISASALSPQASAMETGAAVALPAIAVGTTIVPAMLGNVPQGPLAAVAASALTLWAVDTLLFRAASVEAASVLFTPRARIARHEAAHLFVGHLLGFRVVDCRLPTARSVFRAVAGGGEKPGVEFARSLAQGDAYRLAAVGLAGVAAEVLAYGDARGGAADLGEVSRLVRQQTDRVTKGEHTDIVRWGMLSAVTLIKAHPAAFERVVEAITQGRGVSDCLDVVDHFADEDSLMVEPFGMVVRPE